MLKTVLWAFMIGFFIMQASGSAAKAESEEAKSVFPLDCIDFTGRSLANGAPKKKKVHPGLAVDGTSWSIASDSKRVVVNQVFPGEAAEKAGVEPGDEIVSVNGYTTEGLPLVELFCAYHMYNPSTLTETLVIKKKDGSQNTLKLQLLAVNKCNPDEKTAWLEIYKHLGY